MFNKITQLQAAELEDVLKIKNHPEMVFYKRHFSGVSIGIL
jgi:hypothetical protein